MKKSLVAAGALVAGLAIAAPLFAWSADDSESRLAQAGPDAPGMGMGMGGMAGRQGGGMMGHHDGPIGGMMHRMMQLPPRQRCEERLARRAGMVAYMAARLNLTAEQKPLADKAQNLMQAAADKERQLCATLKPEAERGQETIVDRLARREQFLAARLQGLQQVRPAVEQLYQVLTPEQKAIINHPFAPH